MGTKKSINESGVTMLRLGVWLTTGLDDWYKYDFFDQEGDGKGFWMLEESLRAW